MRTGIAHLPLHGGHCPRWLFPRMKEMSSAITEVMIYEYGQEEFLKRLSDPHWFQAFGCVLGFDYHSSGLTTTLMGALKEGLQKNDLGIRVAGGKGKVSRKAPEEIEKICDGFSIKSEKMVYASKMSAKVDNTAVQDGYQLYHHTFVLTEKAEWCVVQQGMNSENKYARRYHWLSVRDFVSEPHNAICCDANGKTLDMVSRENEEIRDVSLDIVNDGEFSILDKQRTLMNFSRLDMPRSHTFTLSKQSKEALRRAQEFSPENYEELISLHGIGPKAVRALALMSELIYGKEVNWKDPARYSFSHGGKDGIPYMTNTELMKQNTDMLRAAVESAKMGTKERLFALRKLNDFVS